MDSNDRVFFNHCIQVCVWFPQWLEILLVAVPSTVQFTGLSAFQVTAVQFRIDQIQGAPSKHLSAFVYWYFCIELVPKSVLLFIIKLLSNYVHAIDLGIRLGCCLFCVVLLSFSLCVKSYFMSSWFLGDPESGTAWYNCTNMEINHTNTIQQVCPMY